MNNKTIVSVALITLTVILAGCGKKVNSAGGEDNAQTEKSEAVQTESKDGEAVDKPEAVRSSMRLRDTQWRCWQHTTI